MMKEKPILFNSEMVRGILCPQCDNSGEYTIGDENGFPQHEQCQFCWTVKNSLFNIKNKCP